MSQHQSFTTFSRRDMLKSAAVSAVGVALPFPAATASASRADEDFERLLRLASVPSLSYAIVDGDRITMRAIGIKKAGETEAVTPDTVYGAASLTKAVFAYVFLGLVHDRVVALDTPVREFLPLPNPDDARAQKITARHLLSHSGGWRNWRFNATQQLVSEFEPGSRWSYSGEGFFFLQRVIEKLTGKSFAQLARERVFDPLEMKRSSIVALAELEPYQATPHDGRGGIVQPFGRNTLLELRKLMTARGQSVEAAKVEDLELALKAADATLPPLPNFLPVNAAASMVTTAHDFGTFLRHIVTAEKHGGTPAAIVDLMMTPQVRCNDAIQWGLGVGLEDIDNRRFAWQWGDNQGFKNFYLADPKNEKAFCIFTNGDRGARVYERVIRSVLHEDHPAFLWA